VKIIIRYFAGHRDITGRSEEDLDLPPGTTVGGLWELLIGRYPRLAGYSGRVLYAVNQEFGTPTTELHDGDEVAFVPPVSGGLPILDVRFAILDGGERCHARSNT
jgi:molybdopterin converting factor subunit 1